MGWEFAHNWPQTPPCGRFEGMSDIVQQQSGRVPRRVLTEDETRVYQNTQETKISRNSPQEGQGLSSNKVTATVFLISGEYHTNLLDRFDDDLKKKRPFLAKKKSNIPPRWQCKGARSRNVGIQRLGLPYSQDLAPCDYFLFPNLKKWLAGQRFCCSD